MGTAYRRQKRTRLIVVRRELDLSTLEGKGLSSLEGKTAYRRKKRIRLIVIRRGHGLSSLEVDSVYCH